MRSICKDLIILLGTGGVQSRIAAQVLIATASSGEGINRPVSGRFLVPTLQRATLPPYGTVLRVTAPTHDAIQFPVCTSMEIIRISRYYIS